MRDRSLRSFLLLSVTGLVACGPEFVVRPLGGVPSLAASGIGVTLTAFAEEWCGDPSDLVAYVTPVAVDLYNAGPNEVRLTLADLELRDQSGRRFAAINPFSLNPKMGAFEHSPAGAQLAARGGGAFGGRMSGVRFSHGPGRVVGPPLIRRSIAGYGPPNWSGFRIAAGLRGYYGPGALYDSGFLYPSYYNDWVWRWGPSSTPYPGPSQDVLAFALPEGVLPPGAHVSGYVYFQNATHRGPRVVELIWQLHDAGAGAALGALHVPLEVLRR